jgi:hypothetical protein
MLLPYNRSVVLESLFVVVIAATFKYQNMSTNHQSQIFTCQSVGNACDFLRCVQDGHCHIQFAAIGPG